MKEYNDKKSKTTKASLPSQEVVEQNVLYHEQVPNAGPPPHLSLPTNPTPSLTPTPTTAKATKETKKKQQEVTKIIEEKPVEERPDDMLEKVDLNDGELFIEENSRKVYVSPCSNQTEQQEDDSALEIARNSKYLDQQMMHSFPLASSSSSRSIRKNVLNAPLCRKVFTSNAYCKNITLTGEAQQVLSEGIQVHLKNILDSVLKICQEKAQEAKAVYPLDKVVERISEDMMEKVGLKLGPQTETVLNEEETNARKFFESYCREDDRKLQAKMLAEQGEDSLAVGNKRKASDLQDKQTWVQLDVSFRF